MLQLYLNRENISILDISFNNVIIFLEIPFCWGSWIYFIENADFVMAKRTWLKLNCDKRWNRCGHGTLNINYYEIREVK